MDFLAGQVGWMLWKDDPDERTLLEVLLEKCAPLSEVRRLTLDVRQLSRERNAEPLDVGQPASGGNDMRPWP
ncbi:hypothetical protein GCM10008957_54390 [Deinococcus ruber]|uniref:Uncharacterized protein n=1 Tax=Deinococcus ruber TaxID=1848197 RepID=A0A918FHP5_9DEIO|nr:hypothetical protein GCM10008957_54390 [Deinococcus ruber]